MKTYHCAPQFIKCSLWITVFVVRVGCIIEAQASGIEQGRSSLGSKTPAGIMIDSTTKSVRKKSSNSFDSRMSSSRSMALGKENLQIRDTCTGKKDGYFPNFGSDCTSYYFCASGYQITYICPPGRRYNGDKCVGDYECPSIGVNSCQDLPNGYYPSGSDNPRTYFYCYNKAKVIELNCDEGKIYDGNWKKCVLKEEIEKRDKEDWVGTNCSKKRNGFYPDTRSGCRKYYYCIGGTKTDLECSDGMVFNGDLCVQKTRFQCPVSGSNTDLASTGTPEGNNSITTTEVSVPHKS